MNKPFTDEEREVMDLLVKAHEKYGKLPTMHPSDMNDWVFFLHNLQRLLSQRIVRRDYPNYFYNNE